MAGQDDSSSEEVQSNAHPTTNGKPAVPPRPRSISAIEYKRNGLPIAGTNAKNIIKGVNFNDDEPCKDNDVANADCKFITKVLLLYLRKPN